MSVFKQDKSAQIERSRDYQQVGKTTTSIRAYQGGHHFQSSAVAAALGRLCSGILIPV